AGRPPYIRRSPEVARRDGIPLIVRQDGRSVKGGPYSRPLPKRRPQAIGLGRGLVGIAAIGLGAAVVAGTGCVEDLARQLGLDRVRLRADAVVGRHPQPFAGGLLGLAGGRPPGRPCARRLGRPAGGGFAGRVGSGRRRGDSGGGRGGGGGGGRRRGWLRRS